MRNRRTDVSPMRFEDLDDVMEIERLGFKSPWSRQIFVEELGREWAYLDVVRERLAGSGSEVMAFCNYWLVRDEVHLLNIASHPERRRAGHATRLLEHVIDFARRHGCRYVTLEVRRSNEGAIRLYRAHGFRAVGVRPRYYVEDSEDAIVMLLDVRPEPE